MKHVLLSSMICLFASSLAADGHDNSKHHVARDIPVATDCRPELCRLHPTTFGVYGELLYLQPNGSDLYYGVEAIGLDPNIAVPAVSPNWKVLEIDPDYQLGFQIGANVLFSKNTSLELNWERIHAHDKESFTAPAGAGFMVGPFFDIGPNSAAYKVASGKVRSHFDQVNFEIGKQLCFFKDFYTKFYTGAAFLRIKENLTSKYSSTDGTITRSVNTSSKFIGGGPQFGVNYRYRIFDHLFFGGDSTLSLFMGRLKNSTTFESTTPELATLGVAQPNSQRTSVPNRTQLIPGFEQKLGFSYFFMGKSFRANLEIGYQCQIYANAVQTVDMTSPQVLPPEFVATPDVGVFAVGFERTLSNYMLTGLYVTAGFQF